MSEQANSRVRWRGVVLDARTRDMLLWAERKSGVNIEPSQGSFRPITSYSGSTHSKAGAVDIRVANLSKDQRVRLVHALKDAGAACWYRKPSTEWGPHIHCLTIGGGKDGTKPIGGTELADSAKRQVRAYDAGKDGLNSGDVDNTYRASKRRFSYKQGKPVAR